MSLKSKPHSTPTHEPGREPELMGTVAMGKRKRTSTFAMSAFLTLALVFPPGHLPAQTSGPLAAAQQSLESGDYEGALATLDGVIAKGKKNISADAYLLRSTARILLGDNDGGALDLRQATEIDPSLRQAWMTLGAIEMAAERYQQARDAFAKARDLDPQSVDGDLNLGAAELLLGNLKEATERFNTHIQRAPEKADALYLVATNYALAGYAALAIEHLGQAIAVDERVRLRAKADSNFDGIGLRPEYQQLVNSDTWKPQPGSHATRAQFTVAYEPGSGGLLGAVVDSLNELQLPFSPHIEVTPSWAIIWGDLRLKVTNDGPHGIVEMTAPPTAFPPGQWKAMTSKLIEEIRYQTAPKI